MLSEPRSFAPVLTAAQVKLDGRESAMVDETNVLLRGCMLQNTEWVLGLVLSAGVETKITFTGGPKPKWYQAAAEAKMGQLTKLTNKLVSGAVCAANFLDPNPRPAGHSPLAVASALSLGPPL